MLRTERPILTTNKHFEVSSKEDISPFVQYISERFNTQKPVIEQHLLANLVEIMYITPELGHAAFIDRYEPQIGRILDVYALWSKPIDIHSEEQYEQLDKLSHSHYKFKTTVDSRVDTLFHLIDYANSDFDSPQEFITTARTQFEDAIRSRVVGSATFVR